MIWSAQRERNEHAGMLIWREVWTIIGYMQSMLQESNVAVVSLIAIVKFTYSAHFAELAPHSPKMGIHHHLRSMTTRRLTFVLKESEFNTKGPLLYVFWWNICLRSALVHSF